ncbi:MAG: hypothetical protein JNK85_07390 [Verrucomicrobiales bacterium]|nr:hypothetical protein [Verrucomicrobiales bacterium]
MKSLSLLILIALAASLGFVPRSNAAQTFVKTITSGTTSQGSEVTLQQSTADTDGTIWVAGASIGPVDLGGGIVIPTPVPNTEAQQHIFLARQDANGAWAWAKFVYGTGLYAQTKGPITIHSMRVTADAIYLSGSHPRAFSGEVVGYVAKISRAGSLLWSRHYVSSSAASVNAVTVGPDGMLYLALALGAPSVTSPIVVRDQNGNPLEAFSVPSGRNACVFKLDLNGTTLWKTFSGSTSGADAAVALASDANSVHVLFNLTGTSSNPSSIVNVSGSIASTVIPPFDGTTAVVADITTDGAWNNNFNTLETIRDLGGFAPARVDTFGATVSARMFGTDLKLLGGKLYVAGNYSFTVLSTDKIPSNAVADVLRRLNERINMGGFLLRLSADTHSPDNAVAYFKYPSEDYLTYPSRISGDESQLYVTGPMTTRLQIGAESSNTGTSTSIDKEITSAQANRFVGKFDLDLNPLWLRTTTLSSTVSAPSTFTSDLLAFDPISQTLFWGGGFETDGLEELVLGDAPNLVRLTSSGIREPVSWGWFTALTAEGRYLRQASLRVESEYNPVTINGTATTVPVTLVFYQGASARLRVESVENPGTRRIVTGYSLNNVPSTADGNEVLLNVTDDTTVQFRWKTQHKLTVLSDHASAGLPGAESPGDPQPLFGETWIDRGETVKATINGIFEPPSGTWGTRFVLSNYTLQLPDVATPVISNLTAEVDRLQVRDFTMQGPATLSYAWTRQFSVSVNHGSDVAAPLLIAFTSGNPQKLAGGRYWFNAGSTVELGALKQFGDLSLKGWRYASPVGTFPSTQLEVQSGVQSEDAQLRTVLTEKSYGGEAFWTKRIPTLSAPVTVLWNYGDSVSVVHTTIGEPITLPPAFASRLSSPKFVNVRPLLAPSGSTGDDMVIWDAVNSRAIPIRPGISIVEWQAGSTRLLLQLFAGFPGDRYQDDPLRTYLQPTVPYRHIANTPPVDLDPSPTDSRVFSAVRYTNGDGAAPDAKFTATRAGKSVLLFYQASGRPPTGDPNTETPIVRVVETKIWNADSADLQTSAVTATIGTKLTSPFDSAGLGTGYVFHEVANYNAEIYDRQNVRGPIIPVNAINGGALPGTQDLVVVWYERADGILWPWKPVYYRTFRWPAGLRIVVASRLGSEGQDVGGFDQPSFDPSTYQDVKIYQQPDRTKPGFNPNEEHARMYPSLHASLNGATVPAAFALRNDLNISTALIAANPSSLGLVATNYTSDPYVLVQYVHDGEPGMSVYAVELEDPTVDDPRVAQLPGASGTSYVFHYRMLAGEAIAAPYPLNLIIGLTPCVNSVSNLFATDTAVPNGFYFEDVANQRTWFIDHKSGAWAVSGDSQFRARYFYPLADDFWYPSDNDADAALTTTGDCIPLLNATLATGKFGVFSSVARDRTEPLPILYSTEWPTNPPVLKVGETLTYAGGENKADNPDAPGLPGVLGFAAGEIVFDSRNPTMSTSASLISAFTARIIAPLEERLVASPLQSLPSNLASPSSPDITVDGDTWYFNKLSPSLQKRVFYRPLAKVNASDPAPGVLGIRGFVNDRTLGASDLTAAPPPLYVLEPNVLTASERDALIALGSGGNWAAKVAELYALSRNPKDLIGSGWNVGLEPFDGQRNLPKPLTALGPGLALVTNPALLDPATPPRAGFVTVVENNHDSLGEAPVSMHVIRVDPSRRYRGALKTILPVNVFDEKITLRHTADFGGNVDEIAYAWWYHEEDGSVKTGHVPGGNNGDSPAWSPFGNADGVDGRNQVDLNGNPTLLLADNLFFAHYRHRNALAADTSWSDWAGAANSSIRDLDSDGKPDYRAQLATGWVKRVLDAVNPYEARIREFGRNNSPSTAASMIQQLGAPFVGPVALNASKDVVENLGLIELYETVLKRARDLSIDASQPAATPGINAAILLASTRLAEFYTLLGHEAWDDALDPTLGFGSESVDLGNLNASRFCFENQLPSLLEEELCLLRGRDENLGRPVYNRLMWNFTKSEGEVAYALNYQIQDVNNDGFLDENDAMKQYPTGHGDAWGHYLSAMRKRYDLLIAPMFDWEARSEFYNLLDVVIGVDFADERAFARTAAARAKVGAEIVNLTFRSRYAETTDAKINGYTDTVPDRAWGVTEWARRAGQAAVFDWVTANAILPPAPSDDQIASAGLGKIDRFNVLEISEIANNLNSIQQSLDQANSGMNALGLDPDVLPFDIDPTHIDVGSTAQIGREAVQGLSHFEQVFERAYEAMRNADAAFNYANDQKARTRQIAQSAESLRRQALAQDLEFRNRLIEIFGTPYEGQIGAGKAYPAGYAGPDLNLFMYVDVNDITPETVPQANTDTYFDEYVSFYDLTLDLAGPFFLDLESHFLDDISLEGNTAVELLGDDLVHLKLPASAGDYTFVAPLTWGQRAAPGRLQTMVGEMLQVQADLALAVGDYDFLIKQLRDRVALLELRSSVNADMLSLRNDFKKTLTDLNVAIGVFEGVSVLGSVAVDIVELTLDSVAESLPTVNGLANDVTSSARGAIKAASAAAWGIGKAASAAGDITVSALENSKEVLALKNEIELDQVENSVELRGMLYDIEELLVNEGVTRIRLFSLREQLRGVLDQYRATLQEGIRLIEERRNANVQLAATTQENRYHDMLFRSTRHESIQRYRTLYDLAQRYCYIAAKAYDYETNFDPNDRASALPVLTKISRARTLGQLGDDFPLAGEGLAGVMASLYDNFRAVEGRLGFNNFQLDTTVFSLAREQARVSTPADWKAVLENSKVADLWTVPEFRKYCRPFAPRSAGSQPGLVLRFASQVVAGRNFFGHNLGPGDSTYDPTLFATKIRAAGIRFEGYPADSLTRTPYVYLVPAGMDYMTVPNSTTLQTRAWNVVDQAIPTPYILGTTDLGRPDWIASLDSLSGNLNEIRRYSSFRAAVLEDDPPLNVTRFIGRSVWNDNWILIIPGQTLHSDATTGVDDFIANVSDIQLTFETYGYSGN